MEHLAPGLTLERQGPFAVLTFDRPDRRNAIAGPMWEALGRVPSVLAADPPRALLLRGAGAHFSAGMDLQPDNPLLHRLLPALQGRDPDALRALIGEMKAWVGALATLPFPVIAAVEGACAGGALEVALTADLLVAARGASFSLPEAVVGMVPDVGGTVRLSRRVGAARATDLILTGRRVDAATAATWGLVDRLVEDGQAFDAALALARDTTRAAPGCARAVLPVLRSVAGQDDPTAFAAETQAGVEGLLSGHVLEGVTAFLERRRPTWALP